VGFLLVHLLEVGHPLLGHLRFSLRRHEVVYESITAMMLELTAEGNLRTSTLRAFDHDQMQAIIRRTKV
jgi:hypothetical protein